MDCIYFQVMQTYSNTDHLGFNEVLGEKVRWELHKDGVCCFQQILEAAPHQTAAIQPFTYLTNHPSKTKKDELIRDVLLCTPTHGHTGVGWPATTCFVQTLDAI